MRWSRAGTTALAGIAVLGVLAAPSAGAAALGPGSAPVAAVVAAAGGALPIVGFHEMVADVATGHLFFSRGGQFRIRADFRRAKDTTNVNGDSGWAYFLVVS